MERSGLQNRESEFDSCISCIAYKEGDSPLGGSSPLAVNSGGLKEYMGVPWFRQGALSVFVANRALVPPR